MEKKIIHFNEQDFNRQREVFLRNLEILNQISREYATLGIGKITPERTQEIISGNFASMESALADVLEKETKNALVKDILETGVFERLEIFQIKAGQLAARFERSQSTAGGIIVTPVEWFSIKDGQFEITTEVWQRIRDERCSNFIENEQEQRIFEATQKLAAAANEWLSVLSPAIRQKYFPLNEPFDFVMINSEGLYEVDPRTDFELLAQ
ncbi:hypothetical protein [Gaoshiqia sp. Z1-71]|uniref:hypothetical protein n=1 Tax=Gaoshiqia hydrogeniformans TaxID=3290090 RepID=UPI003BF901EE